MSSEKKPRRLKRPRKKPEAFWARKTRERREARREKRRRRQEEGRPIGLKWYVAATAGYGESRAADSLFEAGIPTYLPEVTVEVVQRRKVLGEIVAKRFEVEKPMFTGYVFLGLSPEQPEISAAMEAEGVSYLIGFDGVPYAMPDTLLPAIEARVAELRAAKERKIAEHERRKAAGEPMHDLKKGQIARVIDGPFAGLLAQIESLVGPDAAKVLLKSIDEKNSTTVPAQMPVAMLSAA